MHALFGTNYRKITRRQHVTTFQPRLEVPEGRLATAILTVNTTCDNTTDTSVLTLRDAITLVNNRGNPASLGQSSMPAGWASQINTTNPFGTNDTIQFAIPDSLKTRGHDWWTIAPSSELSYLTDTVTVDGWSQGGTGYHGAPLIMLDGTNAGEVNGLTVFDSPAVPDGCVIQGLAVGNFYQAGIDVHRATNTIVQGCHVGLAPSGTTAAPDTTYWSAARAATY